jgi:hypothetical protein
MTRNRYNKDLVEQIRELEQRVQNLERSRQLTSSSIDSGSLKITNGFLLVEGAAGSDRGQVRIASYTANSDLGYFLGVDRAEKVDGGERAMQVKTVSGGDFSTVEFFDKAGGPTFVGDTSKDGFAGMADPQLHTVWHDPNTLTTTTSTTFTVVAAASWYMYHPHLRIELVITNDAAAISEVRVRDPVANTILAEDEYPGGSNGYFYITVDRANTESGFPGVNGNPTYFYVEHRRSDGSGSARTGIADMLGTDLSSFV